MTAPKLPIPQPLRGSDPGSFAQNTVLKRLPDIARRVISENSFPQRVVQKLENLIQEIPLTPIKHLNDSNAPDMADWAQYIDPHLGDNWLQIPWFLAETYFYRRILEATGYFEAGEGYQVDPYAHQKQQGLETHQAEITGLSAKLNTWAKQPDKRLDNLATLLTINLWGNQADLSLWPAGHGEQPKHSNPEASRSHIVVNHTRAVVEYLAGLADESPGVDFIVDNAGFELVCDLALADFLLNSHLAAVVALHVKFHPTFVSDAIDKDITQTINFLANSPHSAVGEFAHRLQAHLAASRLQLQHDLFWTSPLSFWEMPPGVRRELGRSSLLISKGDANYRRLLGDRHWPYTTPFADIVSYLPAPLVALRTFKSEVAAGLAPEQIQALNEQDPRWLTNGKRGVIQFVN